MNTLMSLRAAGGFRFTGQELVLNEEPLLYIPELTRLIGKIYKNLSNNMIDSLILQRIHFEIVREGYTIDNFLWINRNLEEWNKSVFKFKRTSILKDALHDLEKHNIIISYVSAVTKMNTYRINYDKLQTAAREETKPGKVILYPRENRNAKSKRRVFIV